MENHPIPQDVTGFKFRLIGSMTVKQFLYVLAGGILACVAWVTPFNTLIRIPLSFFFGAIGAALAFIPIEGRSMDVMVVNFLKAIPAENLYVYRKRGAEALIASYFAPQASAEIKEEELKDENEEELARKRTLLKNTLKLSSLYKPDAKDISNLSNINSYFADYGLKVPQSQETTTAPPPIDKSPEEEVPVEIRVVSPPRAVDMSPKTRTDNEFSRPVSSSAPIYADANPDEDNKKQPIRIEIQEKLDEKEQEEESRINETIEQEMSDKSEPATFSLSDDKDKAVADTSQNISVQVVSETPDTVANDQMSVNTSASMSLGGTTGEASPTSSALNLQTNINPDAVLSENNPTASISQETTGKANASVPPIMTENNGKIPEGGLPNTIVNAKEAFPKQAQNTYDSALQQALEEIQKIETSPAPIKIEPIQKKEESLIPEQKESQAPLQPFSTSTPEDKKTPDIPSSEKIAKTSIKSTTPHITLTVSHVNKKPSTTQPESQNEDEQSLMEPVVISPIKKSYQAILPNQSSHVHVISAADQLMAGFPQLPDIPNIVLGIIKDPRGKVLQNILVEIINNQGTPVRAFKTNALGQFTAATPLANGEYDVILEDGRKVNEFENIHITLDGSIFQPLEIYSVDDREKLRRELFGTTQGQQQMATL